MYSSALLVCRPRPHRGSASILACCQAQNTKFLKHSNVLSWASAVNSICRQGHDGHYIRSARTRRTTVDMSQRPNNRNTQQKMLHELHTIKGERVQRMSGIEPAGVVLSTHSAAGSKSSCSFCLDGNESLNTTQKLHNQQGNR